MERTKQWSGQVHCLLSLRCNPDNSELGKRRKLDTPSFSDLKYLSFVFISSVSVTRVHTHVMYESIVFAKKIFANLYKYQKGHKSEWHKKLKKVYDSAVICSFSSFAEGENPYPRNGKWKISFKATYNEDHCERRGKRDWKEETSNDQTQYLFSWAIPIWWATTRRCGFLCRGEFSNITHTSSLHPFESLFFGEHVDDSFFNLAHAFVTRNIVITLWILVTAFDWQAIVDALCEFHGMIIATGYSTMDLLPTGSFVFIQGAGIETAGTAFFLGPVRDVTCISANSTWSRSRWRYHSCSFRYTFLLIVYLYVDSQWYVPLTYRTHNSLKLFFSPKPSFLFSISPLDYWKQRIAILALSSNWRF